MELAGGSCPASLLDTCVVFVARNASCVDSLRGFPEDVGRLVWDRWLEFRAGDDEVEKGVLKTFCDAYPDLVLPSLRVRSRTFLDSRAARECLPAAARLDASGIDLRDKSWLLPACHAFPNLRVLALRDNAITAAGARALLGPHHLKGRRGEAFPRLHVLDLRGNAIGAKNFVMFAAVASINSLLGSFTPAQFKMLSTDFTTLFEEEEDVSKVVELKMETSGWAAATVEKLQSKMLEVEEGREFLNPPPAAATGTKDYAFVRRRAPLAKRRKMVVEDPPSDDDEEEDEHDALMNMYKNPA